MSTMEPAAQAMRPPRYPNEGPLQERSTENDVAALRLARLALHGLVDQHVKDAARRNSPRQRAESNSCEAVPTISLATQASPELREQAAPESIDMATPRSDGHLFGDIPDFMLPLKSMYDGTGAWPRHRGLAFGGKHNSWANIGFPGDESLIVPDIEQSTHIDHEKPSIVRLSEDIASIKAQASDEITDGGNVDTQTEHNRTIERFSLHGQTVCKVKLSDCKISNNTYSGCGISKATETIITKANGAKPTVAVVQWVTAHVLLARSGQIGGRSQDYWKHARNLAHQQLYINPDLEAEVQQQMEKDTTGDVAFTEMLEIAKQGIKVNAFNPYHQAKRDEYGVSNGVFYRIEDTDIVMVLDQDDEVILFQLSSAFTKLLTEQVQQATVQALETYSTLHPVPLPDMTRHGLHYMEWLVEHPEFDFRRPESDLRKAKSGAYHFGHRCGLIDPQGKHEPRLTRDLGSQFPEVETNTVMKHLYHLRYGALGACTEMIRLVFGLLDPNLLDDYTKVAKEVGGIVYQQPFVTRRENEVFCLRAILINLMTYEHVDRMDWHHGFAALVPMGDYQGGDLLTRELGLQIESRPGCLQLLRGRELRHSITKWTGRRFVVVSTTHNAVKRWAFARMGKDVPDEPAEIDDCLDIGQEDVLPEDQRLMSDRERVPERYGHSADDDGVLSEDEASMNSGSEWSLGSELRGEGNKRKPDEPVDGSEEAGRPQKKPTRVHRGDS
ncbi:Uu.00g069720.m01.CDS01 [Anthostomella pinea]|uniref:Uu.00g069720.m01.CDS01 n=1 Tax=Anthostomella pinea TaxID=933095 RepID=A0AAI8VUJ2_9PEZI|nr:Uu.00g069720.m01.CDS01 [Anthostomella pinea]